METQNIFTAIRDTIEELAPIRAALQARIALANLIGDQELAHSLSKDLCAVMSLEFKLKDRLK